MVAIIIKKFIMSDDKVILIKLSRKKKELRKNYERRIVYTFYFLLIFLRIVELLSMLYFHSPTCSCWITLFHLVHAPRIERKTLREVVLSITNERIERMLAKKDKDGYTKVTQAAVEAEHRSRCTAPHIEKMVTRATEAEPGSASTVPQILKELLRN